MNEILAGLHARKSVRAFSGEPVTPQEKRAILEAACAAPTAGNQQLYTILDITDPALKDRLAETCDHQPFIAGAPVVLIFCADCQKWYDAYRAAGCAPRSRGARSTGCVPGGMCAEASVRAVQPQRKSPAAPASARAVKRRFILHLLFAFLFIPLRAQFTRRRPKRNALCYLARGRRYGTMKPSL